jgi:hypothetical protein
MQAMDERGKFSLARSQGIGGQLLLEHFYVCGVVCGELESHLPGEMSPNEQPTETLAKKQWDHR